MIAPKNPSVGTYGRLQSGLILGGIPNPYKFTIPIAQDLEYAVKVVRNDFTYEEAKNGITLEYNGNQIVGFSCTMSAGNIPVNYILSVRSDLIMIKGRAEPQIITSNLTTDPNLGNVCKSRIAYDEVILDAEWIESMSPNPQYKYMIFYLDPIT